MKYNNLKMKLPLLVAMLFIVIFSACQDDDDLAVADRLFRPTISETSYGGTWIKAEWDQYENVEYYELKISDDSLKTFVQEVTTDTSFYIFENLEYDTDYYLQIKSVGETLESRPYVNKVITTSDYPTQLNSISSSDVIDNQVRVSWESVVYDSLRLFKNDTLITTVALTDSENEKKERIIKNLVEESSYVVKAYSEGNYLGKKSFTTMPAQTFEGDVIDLRSYSEEESYSLLSQEYFDQLAIDHPNGVTLVLAGGMAYELTGPTLSSNVSIVTGYSLNGKAVIAVSGNFDVDGAANIQKLYFEGISFTDHPDKPKTTDSNFGGTYIFNVSNSGAAVDSLTFEDCEIRYKRGVIRIKTAATISAITMNNCLIDSIGGYGVIKQDNSSAVIEDIRITNSTITHAQKFVEATKAPTLKSFTIKNLTACFVPGTSNYYLFDLKGQLLENGFSITKSLFGMGWNTDMINGYRSSAASVTIKDNYRTSDLVWTFVTDEAGAVTVVAPMDINQLSGDIYSVFADPDNNDFSVSDDRLKDKVGDSRWW